MIFLRVFFLLLVFANLMLFLWGQGMLGGQLPNGEPERLAAQIEPEKLTLAPHSEPPAKPGDAAPPPAEPAPKAAAPEPKKPAPTEIVCQALAGLSRDQARVVLSKLKSDANGIKATSHALGDAEAYWVMYPALANRALAEKKAAELRALGVTDLFVMSDDTPHPNAISLGLFKSREKADDYLASLRQKSVRMARIVVRESANARYEVELTGSREAVSARVSQLLASYRGIERIRCGADR